jgi:hypothetical protein
MGGGMVWFACRWSQWWSSTRRASQTASISTSESRREDLRPSDVSRASTSCTSTALTQGNSQHRRARACCCDQGLSTPTVPYHSEPSLAALLWQGHARRGPSIQYLCLTRPSRSRGHRRCAGEGQYHTLPALFARRRVKQTQSHFAHRPDTGPETFDRGVSSSTAGALSSTPIRHCCSSEPRPWSSGRVLSVVVLGCWVAGSLAQISRTWSF